MSQNTKKILASLIKDAQTLLQEESIILANESDANYFRSANKKSANSPSVLPQLPKPFPKSAIPNKEPPRIQEPDLKNTTFPPLAIKEIPPPKASPPAMTAPVAEPKKPPSWTSSDLPSPTEMPNFSTLKSLFNRLAPQITIMNEIPSDAEAKKIASRWKTKNQVAPISILYLSEPGPQKELLAALSKAIDIYFGPARLISAESIEKEKQWEAFLSSGDLKWVIACDYTLWQLAELMRNYKEFPTKQRRTLGNIPLFLLPDLSLYLKDPLLKRSLWKALCQTLSS